jgi:hypothetical protein
VQRARTARDVPGPTEDAGESFRLAAVDHVPTGARCAVDAASREGIAGVGTVTVGAPGRIDLTDVTLAALPVVDLSGSPPVAPSSYHA